MKSFITRVCANSSLYKNVCVKLTTLMFVCFSSICSMNAIQNASENTIKLGNLPDDMWLVHKS